MYTLEDESTWTKISWQTLLTETVRWTLVVIKKLSTTLIVARFNARSGSFTRSLNHVESARRVDQTNGATASFWVRLDACISDYALRCNAASDRRHRGASMTHLHPWWATFSVASIRLNNGGHAWAPLR